MTKHIAAIVAAVAVLLSAPIAARQRAVRDQHVVVSVLDKAGATVAGLTPADFAVKEEGVVREVVRVGQASTPMQITVLADTSDRMQVIIQDLRAGLRAFSRAVWAKSPTSDIKLVEFGERPAVLSAPTTQTAVLDRAIDRLFEHSGSGAYALDALLEEAAALQKRHAERPVMVLFLRESTTEFSQQRFQEVERAVKDAHASLWVVVLAGGGSPNLSDETRNRDVVLGDVSAKSGGTREVLLDRMGIEPRFTQMAERLTSQYDVTYARPESLIPPSTLDVSVKRPGARVLGPRWTGQ